MRGSTVVLGLVLVAGCRYRFDPVQTTGDAASPSGDGGADGDGNVDPTPDAFVPTRLVCGNPNQRVTTSGNARNPALVWTGSEYGLAWTSGAETRFRRIDASGGLIGIETVVSGSNPVAVAPSLVWDGTGYVVAWVEGTNASTKLVHLDAAGNVIGQPARITPQSSEVYRSFSLVFTGTEYAIAWDQGATMSFGRRDAAGATLGTDVSFSTSFTGDMSPSLVWNGSDYALAYSVNGVASCPDSAWRIEHRLISGTGLLQAPRTVDTWGRFGFASCSEVGFDRLAFAGPGYGVTWNRSDGQGGSGTFAVLDAFGMKQGSSAAIGPKVSMPVVRSSGANYGLAWVDDTTSHVVSAIRDLTGAPVGVEYQVTDSTTVTGAVEMVGLGTGYAIAWSDTRDATGGEIYIARACP